MLPNLGFKHNNETEIKETLTSSRETFKLKKLKSIIFGLLLASQWTICDILGMSGFKQIIIITYYNCILINMKLAS